MKNAYKQNVTLALILLLVLPGIIAAQEGADDEKTPIATGQPREVEVEGILELLDGNLLISTEDGKSYLVNTGMPPMTGGNPMGGRLSGGKGGGMGGRGSGQRPDMPPPEVSSELLSFEGSTARISGTVLEAPEGRSPFGEAKGVLFARSAVIDGREIFF